LQTLGIGIELVAQELKRLLPDVPVFQFDRDSITTHRNARSTIQEFYETPGSILLGTEMVLPYLTESVATSVVVSLDSLLSVPEWNIYERILSIVLRIRERTEQDLFIQTRKPDEEILDHALKGNLGAFYRAELKDRKEFNYPPFTTLIKVSIDGTPAQIRLMMEQVENALKPYGFTPIPHVLHTSKAHHVMHGFLRMKREQWPNDDLATLLKSFPSNVTVEVDPRLEMTEIADRTLRSGGPRAVALP